MSFSDGIRTGIRITISIGISVLLSQRILSFVIKPTEANVYINISALL